MKYIDYESLTPEQKRLRIAAVTRYNRRNRDKVLLAARKSNLKRNYGLTLEQYDKLLDAQKGGCSICRKAPSGRFKYLAVDHNHETGAIRGLLCTNCNIMIGHSQEDPNLLILAAGYLGFHVARKAA